MNRYRWFTVALFAFAVLAGSGAVAQSLRLRGWEDDELLEASRLPGGSEEQETPQRLRALTSLMEEMERAQNLRTICMILCVAALATAIYLIWWRRNLLFLVAFDGERLLLRQGRVSGDVLDGFRDCLRDAQIPKGEIWASPFGRRGPTRLFKRYS